MMQLGFFIKQSLIAIRTFWNMAETCAFDNFRCNKRRTGLALGSNVLACGGKWLGLSPRGLRSIVNKTCFL